MKTIKLGFIVVICLAFLFIGCEQNVDGGNDKDWEDFAIFWPGGFAREPLQGLPFDRYFVDGIPVKIVITDTTMLHEIFADTYSLSFNEAGNGWERDERFSDSIAKYDDKFFESRQLVTFFLAISGGGEEFKLGRTTFKDGILNININKVRIGWGPAVPIDFFAIVETKKVPSATAVYVNVTDWLGRVFTF